MSPTSSPLVLAVDLGSSGIRVALVDEAGRALASATESIPMTLLPDGTAEEDAEEIWRALGRSIERALAEAPEAGARVAAILCGSQYSSLVPVDAAGRPLGPLVLYLDTRAAALSRALTKRRPELWKLWLERHGMPSGGGGSDSLAHLLWFQSERPEIHAAAHAYVEPMDYLTARLTGRVTANVCTAVSAAADRQPPRRGGRLVRRAHRSVGRRSRQAARNWWRPTPWSASCCRNTRRRGVCRPRIRVFSAINDTQALTFGTGSHVGDRLGVSIGTTLVPTTLVDSMRADLRHFLLSQPAPIPDKHVLMAEGGLAGKALEFVLEG